MFVSSLDTTITVTLPGAMCLRDYKYILVRGNKKQTHFLYVIPCGISLLVSLFSSSTTSNNKYIISQQFNCGWKTQGPACVCSYTLNILQLFHYMLLVASNASKPILLYQPNTQSEPKPSNTYVHLLNIDLSVGLLYKSR